LLILCFSIVLVVLPGALIQENEIKPIHVWNKRIKLYSRTMDITNSEEFTNKIK
jgi:hypothetical protein